MPYRLDLTWIQHAKKWRKRYRGRTYYLKSKNTGKSDRAGYLAAVQEWEKLKNYLDGFGDNPYSLTGVLIPGDFSRVQLAPATNPTPILPAIGKLPTDPPWILSVGLNHALHPEQIVQNTNGNPYAGERRIDQLCEYWLTKKLEQAERGDLSFKQYAEERTKLQTFRDFLATNYPTVVYVDQIDANMLNLFRDKQQEILSNGKSKVTLRKRLGTVARFFYWLVDQNIIATPPKDLRSYARVKLDRPPLVFFTVNEIRVLAELATNRTRLYLMLGLNLGWTQKDVATFTPDMLNWETGIVTRDRHKTGVATLAKLWPSTLKLLAKYRNPRSGPILVDENGNSLLIERINGRGKLTTYDSIRQSFERLLVKAGITGRSFKHLRKTAANEIEKTRPDLTSLFLAHSERATKKFYVAQQFQELFSEVAKLETLFGFA